MNIVRFGVAWDKPTTRVLTAILRDAFSYSKMLPPDTSLCLVSKAPEFLIGSDTVPRSEDGLYDFGGLKLGVEKHDAADNSGCEAWKLYYEVRRPDIPTGATQVYYQRVGNNGVKRIKLQKDAEHYPSLYNPSDNRIVPPGMSPNIQKIPPYAPRNFPTTPYRLI